MGHDALGVEKQDLPERALGFKKPEPVQLDHTLIEKLLRLGALRRHRKVADARDPRQQFRPLPWAFGKTLTVYRMPGLDRGFVGMVGPGGHGHERQHNGKSTTDGHRSHGIAERQNLALKADIRLKISRVQRFPEAGSGPAHRSITFP
jgi:hypothetical protein